MKDKKVTTYPKIGDTIKPNVNHYWINNNPSEEQKNDVIKKSIELIKELRDRLKDRDDEILHLVKELKKCQDAVVALKDQMEKDIENMVNVTELNEDFKSELYNSAMKAARESLGKKFIDESNIKDKTIKSLQEEIKCLQDEIERLSDADVSSKESTIEAEAKCRYFEDMAQLYEKEKDDAVSSMEDLKSQIMRLTAAITKKDEEINYLKSRNGIPILYFGDEKDLYQGEQHDIIIEALEERLKSIYPGSRSEDVLKSILRANPKYGFRDSLKDKISNFFKSFNGWHRLTKAQRNLFFDIGFKLVDHQGHPKFIFCDDSRYTLTLSYTPSDSRGMRNQEFDTKQKIL